MAPFSLSLPLRFSFAAEQANEPHSQGRVLSPQLAELIRPNLGWSLFCGVASAGPFAYSVNHDVAPITFVMTPRQIKTNDIVRQAMTCGVDPPQ